MSDSLSQDDSYSSFDYDEFGIVESCYPDRIVIKPLRNDLAKDIVLFDRMGNFLGPISEVTGEYSTQRYVIRLEEDSLSRMKRKYLKTGDYVYYYNCDRLHAEQEEMTRELNLIELKRQNRNLHKKPKTIRNQIMNGVISNLKDLRLDSGSKNGEETCEDDQRSTSKNSKTIISMVIKSHCNPSLVGSAKEKQKRKKYKKAKAKMFLNQLSELQTSEMLRKNTGRGTEIEDELLLGKRCPISSSYRKDKMESSFLRSTECEPKCLIEDEILFKSISMNEDGVLFPSPLPITRDPLFDKMNEEGIQSSSKHMDRVSSHQH